MAFLGNTYRSSPDVGADAELRLSRLALAATHDGVIMHRPDGTLVLFNEAAARNLGFTVEQFAALPPFGWTAPAHAHRLTEITDAARCPGGHTFRSHRRLPDGREIWQEVHSRFVDTPDGGLVVSVSYDVTSQVRAERLLRELAYHDPLTGLANRAAFDEKLDAAISAARRHSDLLGVVFVDLDDFKKINDSFGHDAGDTVLVALAHRLEGAVRAEDLIARLGGDEFVVLLPRLDHASDLEVIAAKLRDAIAKPLTVDDREFDLSASTGSSLFDPKIDDARSLLVRADIGMYESKRRRDRVPSTR